MLTIFAVPKPFTDPHIVLIQNNAIRSWLALPQQCEVLLLGDEPGIAEIAKELNIKHFPDVVRNEYGTPLVNSAFEIAEAHNTYNILAYVNADIILMSDFIAAIRQVQSEESCLLVGRRYNLDLKESIDFTKDDWEINLRARSIRFRRWHSHWGTDYFVFPRDFWGELPPLALGRGGFDNWLLYRARSQGAKVIDATRVVIAVHQNHHYNHLTPENSDVFHEPEGAANLKLAGGFAHMFTIEDATNILTSKGLRKALFTLKPIHRYLLTVGERFPRLELLTKLARAILSPYKTFLKIGNKLYARLSSTKL